MKSYTAFLLYNSDFSILTLFIDNLCEANVDKIFHLGIIYTLIQQILFAFILYTCEVSNNTCSILTLNKSIYCMQI